MMTADRARPRGSGTRRNRRLQEPAPGPRACRLWRRPV